MSQRRKYVQMIGPPAECCWLCGRPLPPEEASVDHLTPRTLGGSSDPENLRWVHADCNAVKAHLPLPRLLEIASAIVARHRPAA